MLVHGVCHNILEQMHLRRRKTVSVKSPRAGCLLRFIFGCVKDVRRVCVFVCVPGLHIYPKTHLILPGILFHSFKCSVINAFSFRATKNRQFTYSALKQLRFQKGFSQIFQKKKKKFLM